MSKYLISFPRQKASAVVEYNEKGFLINYTLEPGSFGTEHHMFFSTIFPKTFEKLQSMQEKKIQNVVITTVEDDLSFERFYELYDYKFGKKAKAKLIWDKMPDQERIKAINYIQRYKQFLMTTGTASKYPETYLNQQIWNN